MKIRNKFFYFFVVVFVLSSCVPRKKILKGDLCKISPFEFDERFLLEQELVHKQPLSSAPIIIDPKLFDIPIPLDTYYVSPPFEAKSQSCESHENEQYVYRSLLERSFLVNFFNEQMEAFGWQKEGIINSFEDMLIFSKSYKKVFISLRSGSGKKNKTFIVISLLKSSQNLDDALTTHHPA